MDFSGSLTKQYLLTIMILMYLSMASCGKEADTSVPGSWGSDKTNTLVYASISANAENLDLCDGKTVYSTAIINTSVINEKLPQNTLNLTKYTVAYEPLDNAPELDKIEYPASTALPASGLSLIMLTQSQKASLIQIIESGQYPSNSSALYNVVFTLTGQDSYGSGFGAIETITMSISTALCEDVIEPAPQGLAVMPSAISLTGIANPDADATDDVLFHISGGTAPYTVYSGNSSLIAPPGALSNSITFDIDPDSSKQEAEVVLTVVDSAGASAISTVTISPAPASAPEPEPQGLAVMPSAISLTGIANPDSDATDDVLFHISGGTAPYTVYSGNSSLIAPPGALTDGIDVFSIDANNTLTSTIVHLTVVDSIGNSSEALVTVEP